MNTFFGTVYADLRSQLQSFVDQAAWPTPECGFLFNLRVKSGESLASLTLVTERFSEAPILASHGYLYAPGESAIKFNEEWKDAFERLVRRDPFPGDRESYFYRPFELLGICIGASRCSLVSEQAREKLRKTLRDGQARIDEDDFWNFSVSSFAAWQLGVKWKRKSLPLAQRLSFEELCLLYWLTKTGTYGKDTDLECPLDTLEERIIKLCFTHCIASTSASKAGIALVVTRDLIDARISASLRETWSTPENSVAAEQIISNLGRRFHNFAVQLTLRHANRRTLKIKDEYDVQDLLHAMLKLHFNDVRPEEWTPSYGGYSTRMDFLLKKEKIVVEAKMTRAGLDQKGILGELTEDIEKYRSHADCKTLICIVYDPGSYCKNPVALENDLRGQRDSLRVVVHVVPKL